MTLLGIAGALRIAVIGTISAGFPRDFVQGEGLGSFLSGVLARVGGTRLAVHRPSRDRLFHRRHRLGDAGVSITVTALFARDAAAAAGVLP
ncbi:MAG TPA: hypothetical protein VKW04_09150 [Planctomycetota bacterium]|jgi:hypothetical protein|nr:hypothetical protein [Planctomycetota bacterium]